MITGRICLSALALGPNDHEMSVAKGDSENYPLMLDLLLTVQRTVNMVPQGKVLHERTFSFPLNKHSKRGEMRKIIVSLMALALGFSTLSAEPSPGFAAQRYVLKTSPAVGDLVSYLNGTHTFYVQPITHKGSFNKNFYNQITVAAKSFWEQQIPGLKIKFALKSPRKSTYAIACDDRKSWDFAMKYFGANLGYKQHLFALGIECGAFGLADLGGQYGFAGTEQAQPEVTIQVLAHEMGHNLGFRHAANLECKDKAGKIVVFSEKCNDWDYGNTFDVMGGGSAETGYGLTGFFRLRASRTSQVYRPSGATKPVFITLNKKAGKSFAMVQTKSGVFLFDVLPTTKNALPLGMQVNVRMSDTNQAALTFPDQINNDTITYLRPGQGWNIPGSKLRFIVDSVTKSGAYIRFIPIPKNPKITAPVLKDQSCIPDSNCTIEWLKGLSSSGISAYQVFVDGVPIELLPGDSTKATVTAPEEEGTSFIQVRLITKDGFEKWSTVRDVYNGWNPPIQVFVNGTAVGTFVNSSSEISYQPGMTIAWKIAGSIGPSSRIWTLAGSDSYYGPNQSWPETVLPTGVTSFKVPDAPFYDESHELIVADEWFTVRSGLLQFDFHVSSR